MNPTNIKGRVPGIRLDVTETDQRFVRAYRVARATEGALEEILSSLCELPIFGTDRRLESLRRLSVYLGGLFTETFNACVELAVLDMPRAQYLLNRQSVEYYARNRWFVEHSDMALGEMDRLPKFVYQEVLKNPEAFEPKYAEEIAKNYKAWGTEHPALDQEKHQIPGITEMVKLSLDDEKDLFWFYGLPSIVAHGKTHGIHEVLGHRPDGTLERSLNSRSLDRVEEIYRVTGYGLQYAYLLALYFGFDETKANALFEETLKEDGQEPHQVVIKDYRETNQGSGVTGNIPGSHTSHDEGAT